MSEVSSTNPYSAPQCVSGLRPDEEKCWRIEGLDLWVREGADFTDVDLANGELFPAHAVKHAVQLEGFVTSLMTIVLATVVVGSVEIYKAISGAKFTSTLAFIPLVFVLPFLTKRLPKANITFALASWRMRRQFLVKRVGGIGAVLGCLCGLAILFLSKGNHVNWGVAIIIFGMLFGGIASVIHFLWSPRLRCIGNQGGWFRITGIAPHIIDHLSKQLEQEESVPDEPRAPAGASALPESSDA